MACKIPVITTGSIVCISEPFVLDVLEGGAQASVETVFTLPAGTVYDSHVISGGSFDSGTLTWLVNLDAVTAQTITICVEITDLALFSASDREISGITTAVSGEVNILNNEASKCLEGLTALDLLPCQSPVIPVLTITDDTIYDPEIHAVLLADASSNTIDVTIDPTDMIVADCGSYELNVKVIDISNAVTLVATSGVIVDFSDIAGAAATLPILNIGESKKIISDGTNLYVI